MRYQLRLSRSNMLWTIFDYGCKWNTLQTFSEREARNAYEHLGGNWHQHPVLY